MKATVLASVKATALASVATTFLVTACVPAGAQQTTGVPGSPSATTTIDGSYLPNPPPAFGGEINLGATNSKPWWPPNIVPPKGAPNVLLIMTDDQGYGISSTFGGVIPTPTMDRIAKTGLRYTEFHSTALCSPSRAAIITGRNHHSVGFGVIAEQATGYPGYDFDHRRRQRHHRRNPERQRICHILVRQEPQHARLSVQHRRTFWPMADWDGL